MIQREDEDLREKVIRCAREAGADLVGIGSVDRFRDGTVTEIFPQTRSVIGIAFRVLRGSLRGVEEGTTYYQYTTTGLETIEEALIPGALLKICAFLEDEGYTAVPQRRNQMLRPEKDIPNPEMLHTRWYPAGAKEPQMDFTAAAVACGLGEMGMSGTLLTDDFGPFQRYAFVLTDAQIEADDLIIPHLCDRCGECVKACPGRAMDESGKKDPVRCTVYYRGASMRTNPFMPPEAYKGMADRREIAEGRAEMDFEKAEKIMDETYFYPPVKHGYVASICGRACDRACYAHLEEKGVLKRKFALPLRIRPAWELPVILNDDS